MSAVLSKIKRLEEYVSLTGESAQDRVWEQALDKLLAREVTLLTEQKTRLQTQLAEFERQYNLASDEFYIRFERGELGDATDFVEWSATYEMIQNLEDRLAILSGGKADKQ
jgi:hypothetical protein